jgi:hypothetical protein
MQPHSSPSPPLPPPPGKTQVTVEYKKEGGAVVPQRVHTILISTQHSPDVTNEQIHKELMEHVIKPVVPAKYLDDKTIFHLNPSGRCAACCQPLWHVVCRTLACLPLAGASCSSKLCLPAEPVLLAPAC